MKQGKISKNTSSKNTGSFKKHKKLLETTSSLGIELSIYYFKIKLVKKIKVLYRVVKKKNPINLTNRMFTS